MRLFVYKFFSLVLLVVGLSFSACSDDTDTNTESSDTLVTTTPPTVLGGYGPTYKEINSMDEAALALDALNIDAKVPFAKAVSDSINEELINDLLVPDVVVSNETLSCEEGGSLTQSIDTKSSYKNVDKDYSDCFLDGKTRDGKISASWPSYGFAYVNATDYSNSDITYVGAVSLKYYILDDENSYDFNISFGVITTPQEQDTLDYSDFQFSNVNGLSLNGTFEKKDSNCQDGYYLVETLEPITFYGYDDTEKKGKIIINDVTYQFNDDSTISVTINGETTTLYQEYFSATCPEDPYYKK